MSTSASIEFSLGAKCQPREFLEKMITGGWTFNDNGHISYLPVGDGGSFEWLWSSVDEWADVVLVIDEKTRRNETIGLALTWEQTNIGGELLISGNKDDEMELIFNLTSNRKILDRDDDYTDFVWYLDRLIPVFRNAGVAPVRILCEHFE